MFYNRMEALTLLIDKHIKRIENEEHNDLVEIYKLFYAENQYLILHFIFLCYYIQY